MLLDNRFLQDEQTKRLGFGVLGAVFTHLLILAWFSMPMTQNIIAADTFSAPTNISVHFLKPVKTPRQITPKITPIEVVKEKPIVKKIAKAIPLKQPPETLNKIEPVAAPAHQPVRDMIPLVSGASLKGRRVQPEYPKRALRLRQEGVVWLHVLISETGARQDIKLHKPSKYAMLNQAALKAVKKWTFDPNTTHGRAVQSWVEIPIEFKIQ